MVKPAHRCTIAIEPRGELRRMAMGTRKSEHAPLWIATSDLPMSPGHPFYARLNAILDAAGFDSFVEARCRPSTRR